MMQTSLNSLFVQGKESWLDNARHTARKIIANRGTCTIEDVLEQCPRPSYLHRNTTGQVFKSPEFVPVGFASSRRNISNGRAIRVWRLKPGYVIPKDGDFERPDTY